MCSVGSSCIYFILNCTGLEFRLVEFWEHARFVACMMMMQSCRGGREGGRDYDTEDQVDPAGLDVLLFFRISLHMLLNWFNIQLEAEDDQHAYLTSDQYSQGRPSCFTTAEKMRNYTVEASAWVSISVLYQSSILLRAFGLMISRGNDKPFRLDMNAFCKHWIFCSSMARIKLRQYLGDTQTVGDRLQYRVPLKPTRFDG